MVSEPAVVPFWSIPLRLLINVEPVVVVAVGDGMVVPQAAFACAVLVAEGA
jgi:hypothetical protein